MFRNGNPYLEAIPHLSDTEIEFEIETFRQILANLEYSIENVCDSKKIHGHNFLPLRFLGLQVALLAFSNQFQKDEYLCRLLAEKEMRAFCDRENLFVEFLFHYSFGMKIEDASVLKTKKDLPEKVLEILDFETISAHIDRQTYETKIDFSKEEVEEMEEEFYNFMTKNPIKEKFEQKHWHIVPRHNVIVTLVKYFLLYYYGGNWTESLIKHFFVRMEQFLEEKDKK